MFSQKELFVESNEKARHCALFKLIISPTVTKLATSAALLPRDEA